MSRVSKLEARVRELESEADARKRFESRDLAGIIWDRLASKPFYGGASLVFDVMGEVSKLVDSGYFTRKEVFDYFGIKKPVN